jgi:tetratricopeptide (TPR) repeat protein
MSSDYLSLLADVNETAPEPPKLTRSSFMRERLPSIALPPVIQTQARIAVYPCSGADADAAVIGSGLLLMLGALLYRFTSTQVYPLPFAPQLANPTAFTPEDWIPDELDANVFIWGRLGKTDGEFELVIWADMEQGDEDTHSFTLKSGSYSGFLMGLTELAMSVALTLDLKCLLPMRGAWIDKLRGGYLSDTDTVTFIRQFYQVHMVWAAGKLPEALDLLTDLNTSANSLNSPLFDWCAATAAVLHAVLSLRSGGEYDVIHRFMTENSHADRGISAASLMAFRWKATDILKTALEVLEETIEKYPDTSEVWVVLALTYQRLSRPDLSIEVCQKAFEHGIQDASLYFVYADSLIDAHDASLHIPSLHFLPTGEIQSERLHSLREGLSALARFELPPQLDRMAEWVIAQVQYQGADPDVYRVFQQLLELDLDGADIETVLQAADEFEDVSWMSDGLKRASLSAPQRYIAWYGLAHLAHIKGDTALAQNAAAKARSLAVTPHQKTASQLLALELTSPGFQAELAELIQKLQADPYAVIYEKDLEFLEYIVEMAPDYAEAHLALSRAYQRVGEVNTALEVLLDAEAAGIVGAELYLTLAELLTDEEQYDLAIEYVQKGLDLTPNDIALLTQAALLSHLTGEEEVARAFLRRAHAISAFHPRIIAVTQRIQSDEDDEGQEE